MSLQSFPKLEKYLAFTESKHLWRILVGYLVVIIIAIWPLMIGFGGAAFEEHFMGKHPNEANSSFVTLMWLCLLTFPLGVGLFVLWTILWIQAVGKFRSLQRSK